MSGLTEMWDDFSGKSAARSSATHIMESTQQALEQLGVSKKIAAKIANEASSRAMDATSDGDEAAGIALRNASEMARSQLGVGFQAGADALIQQADLQKQQLAEAKIASTDPLEAFSNKGLDAFGRGLAGAESELGKGSAAALEAERSGFGKAAGLGEPLQTAGTVGLGGLTDFVSGDSAFLDRKLDKSGQVINADLASKGLYGSSGGVQLVGEGAQNILEADEAKKLEVLNTLTGLGANQTGTQQNLAVQEGLGASAIQQNLGANKAELDKLYGTGNLSTNVNLGKDLSGVESAFGAAGANVTGGLGTDLSALNIDEGKGLAGVTTGEGSKLADLALNTSGRKAGIISDLGKLRSGQETNFGNNVANLMTNKGAGLAQVDAARSRTSTSLFNNTLKSIGEMIPG